MTARIIDAHQHFWQYTAAEYEWIDEPMAVLRHDFLPTDIEREIAAAGVDAVVSVQARQTIEETQWLLRMSQQFPFIAGVVGWLPLASSSIEAELERLAGDRKLRGVRHVLQGEDDEYMLTAEFNRGLGLLDRFGLAYDLLILGRQLPAAIRLVDAHPRQVFILDHAAKPLIRSRVFEPWRTLIGELAERPNVYCKISGMVTEDDWATSSIASVAPYIDGVLEAFGPRRSMYGSDWPVCLLASTYSRWMQTVREALGELSEDEQSWIFGRTAEEAYRLTSAKEDG
ncbi:MAG TPA: amidohydrolase family protein [Acidisarcina sp.]